MLRVIVNHQILLFAMVVINEVLITEYFNYSQKTIFTKQFVAV